MKQAIKHKSSEQSHLQYSERINLGSYYTSDVYVDIVWQMIIPFLTAETAILDSSCGYGNFFNIDAKCQKIGNDIDDKAIAIAKQNHPEISIYNHNALQNVCRSAFAINENQPLIILGNPPYNDITSIVRSAIKKQDFVIDDDIITRDLGMSFLLSYNKLQADYICVLHPLSYLIKPSNFGLLKNFAKNYRLKNSLIISSSAFSNTSKSMQFPIIIALYERNKVGMDYDYIKDFQFQTSDKQSFCINDFSFICSFLNKYPTKNYTPQASDIYFHTMRDLNALKRNKSFVKSYNENAIVVDKNKLDYYVYVDVVKDFANVFPYYLGNFDVLIDAPLFDKYKRFFIEFVAVKYDFIKLHYGLKNPVQNHEKITEYFEQLLGEHYVKN